MAQVIIAQVRIRKVNFQLNLRPFIKGENDDNPSEAYIRMIGRGLINHELETIERSIEESFENISFHCQNFSFSQHLDLLKSRATPKAMSCTFSLASNQSTRSRRSKKVKKESNKSNVSCNSNKKRQSIIASANESDDVTETDCNEGFTASGCDPAKTVGPLNKRFDNIAKYAPCGHWASCPNECGDKKRYDACESCPSKAPFGPYGPWSKNGPAKFISPRADYLKRVYPRYKKICRDPEIPKRPMGKLAPWPLSGSCRFAGRPYGPTRPFGAYRSRGPFGAWDCNWPIYLRPPTPRQPCWRPTKGGRRPCTPCHRPLYRPCKPSYLYLIS